MCTVHNSVTAKQPHPRPESADAARERSAGIPPARFSTWCSKCQKSAKTAPLIIFDSLFKMSKKCSPEILNTFPERAKKRRPAILNRTPRKPPKSPPQPLRNPSVTPDNPRARRRPQFVHRAQFAFSNGQAPAPAPAAAEAPMPAEEDLPFRPRLACLVRACDALCADARAGASTVFGRHKYI